MLFKKMVDCEEIFEESNIAFVKIIPMVEYDGNQMYKATLVSQLNVNLFVYKDMLMQVKN